jgi:arginyl-tRNA synthetase
MNKKVNGNFDNQSYRAVADYMRNLKENDRTPFLATSYVLGSSDYESDTDRAKYWIEDLNGELYQTVFSDVAEDYGDLESRAQRAIFSLGREWSRQYFDSLYARLQLEKQPDGSFFRYYPESETAESGRAIVVSYSPGFPGQEKPPIFARSEGAIVFPGEKYGLHTRVFISRKGLPTYEAKDLGLIFIEKNEFKFDNRILMTGNDQVEYMKVVWKAADMIEPGIASDMTHLAHGTIRFGDGKKMSSRLGNVTRAVDVLDSVSQLVEKNYSGVNSDQTMLGAVKYEFLKYRLGGDIAFDPEESVALEGNSGPYLQYAHARAKSILSRTDVQKMSKLENLEPAERSLVRKISEYTEIIERATDELMPHHICTYLYELAQEFNRFYEHNRVVGDPREAVRLSLVKTYAQTLKSGLELLGISAPEQM